MHCLLYFDSYSKSEPILTLGPDWPYVAAKFLIINFIVGYSINTFEKTSWFHYIFEWVLFTWNILFVVLCLWNPGIAPKDPNVHSIEYLKKLQSNNHIFKICKKCNIIHRERAPGWYNIHHC